jgi:Winged helix-turn helix
VKQAKDAAQARRLLASAAARRELADRGGDECGHGPPDAAARGDPFQRAGAGRSGLVNIPSPGAPPSSMRRTRGPDPGDPWCGALARARPDHAVHEEFGLSVSDDTVYRALKDLGSSHLSARPRAYIQDTEAMETFKKLLRPPGPPKAHIGHFVRSVV